MKRIVIILAVFALTLSACGGSVNKIGCTEAERKAGRKDCFATGVPTIATTPPPTTTPPKVKSSPVKPPPEKVDPTYKGRTYTVVIKDTSGYSPVDLRLFVGDIILFKNRDPNLDHSYSENKGTWNSGPIKNGKTWTYKVTAKPGIYYVHDESVGYILGGPIEVLATPKS